MSNEFSVSMVSIISSALVAIITAGLSFYKELKIGSEKSALEKEMKQKDHDYSVEIIQLKQKQEKESDLQKLGQEAFGVLAASYKEYLLDDSESNRVSLLSAALLMQSKSAYNYQVFDRSRVLTRTLGDDKLYEEAKTAPNNPIRYSIFQIAEQLNMPPKEFGQFPK